ncbi:MAG: hypothetical protein R2848_04225 [Thermomicrobiales bacterium]
MTDSRIRLDYRNVMASAVGDANGLTEEQLQAIAPKAAREIERIWAEHAAGDQKWIDLPDNRQIVDEIEAFADENRAKYDDFILIGIGGSHWEPFRPFRRWRIPTAISCRPGNGADRASSCSTIPTRRRSLPRLLPSTYKRRSSTS